MSHSGIAHMPPLAVGAIVNVVCDKIFGVEI
jgi:hypothetical protein